MVSRGGPTIPRAPSTPGTLWQVPQPYLWMRAGPRCGSPPVSALAVFSTSPWPHAPRRRASPSIHTALRSMRAPLPEQPLAPRVGHPALRFAEPRGEEAEPEEDEDCSRGDPHDKARELLVLQGREPPRGR